METVNVTETAMIIKMEYVTETVMLMEMGIAS